MGSAAAVAASAALVYSNLIFSQLSRVEVLAYLRSGAFLNANTKLGSDFL